MLHSEALSKIKVPSSYLVWLKEQLLLLLLPTGMYIRRPRDTGGHFAKNRLNLKPAMQSSNSAEKVPFSELINWDR